MLDEAKPDSLGELFSRDPLGLTDQDLDKIIATLREARLAHAQAPAPKGKKPVVNVNLDDLLGGL